MGDLNDITEGNKAKSVLLPDVLIPTHFHFFSLTICTTFSKPCPHFSLLFLYQSVGLQPGLTV